MEKAPSVFLRNEIFERDVERIICWINNPEVTKYLNEDPSLTESLARLLKTVPAPMLTYNFNRDGRFFVVCLKNGDESSEPVGFVKLKRVTQTEYEIVYAIGEVCLWGRGYGKRALYSAVNKAFFEMRATNIVARVHPENHRSVRSVRSCGFVCEKDCAAFHRYSLSDAEYLTFLRSKR